MNYTDQSIEAIIEMSARFAGTTDVNSAILKSLQNTGELCHADRAYVFLFSDDLKLMDNTHEWCAVGVEPQKDFLQNLPCKDFPWWVPRILAGKDIRISDVSKMPQEAQAEKEILQAQNIKAVMVLPLRIGGQIRGFLGLDDCRHPAQWNDEQIRLLWVVSDMIGTAIHRKKHEDELQKTYKLLEERVKQRTEQLSNTNERLFKEIAERKEAEIRLKRSESQYRAIVTDQTNLICRFTPEGKLTFVNDAYCKYFNKSPQELIGKKFMPLIPPEDHAIVEQIFSQLSPQNPVVTCVHRVILPDGGIAWQEWIDRAIYDDKGQIICYQSVGQDITKRKKAELALKESKDQLENRVIQRTQELLESNKKLKEEIEQRRRYQASLDETQTRFLSFINNLPGLFFIKDLQGRYQHFGGDEAAALDIEPNECIGKNDKELWPEETANSFIQADKKVIDNPKPIQTVETFLHDGITKYFLATKFPILRKNGEPTSIGGIVLNITSRHEAEKALEHERDFVSTLVDTINSIIMVLDMEENIKRMNRFGRELLGVTEQEILGENWAEKMVPFKSTSIKQKVSKSVSCEKSPITYENKILTKKGETLLMKWSATPLKDPDGMIRYILWVGQDITELRNTEKRLQEAHKMEAVGRMAAGVAHEINNPLAGIKMAYSLIKNSIPQDHQYYSYAQRIDSEISRVSKIVKQMYDLYQPSHNRPEMVDLLPVVKSATELLAPRCREHKTQIHIEENSETFCIYAAKNHVLQILLNIMGNAIDASLPSQKVRVFCVENKNFIRVSIKDSGKGIPGNIQNLIYEPFFSTKNTHSHIDSGMGLGLSISQSLIKTIGGELSFETTVDVGTVFHMDFPKMKDRR